MAQRTTPEIRELQEMWRAAVVIGGGTFPRFRPCWFGANVPGIDSCEGPIEGAHWIKRQRVENTIGSCFSCLTLDDGELFIPSSTTLKWWIALAAWDPRNGVPACEKHHRRFDGQRVDATNELVIWRHEVPAPVESFCRDWPLEVALEDRNPAIGAGV